MYKELKEEKVKTCTEILKEHSGKAFLMLNPYAPYENGVTLDVRGSLYAIADKEGVDQLYKTSHALKRQGIKTVVNTIPLLDGKYTFINI